MNDAILAKQLNEMSENLKEIAKVLAEQKIEKVAIDESEE